MARRAATHMQSVIEEAVARVVARLANSINRAVADRVAEEMKRRPVGNLRRAQSRAGRRARGAEITRWVADRRARRVPLFVIELTGGLDTKKKIVAKYGENVVFEKGKPAPKPARAA